jgi:hypothetical protein
MFSFQNSRELYWAENVAFTIALMVVCSSHHIFFFFLNWFVYVLLFFSWQPRQRGFTALMEAATNGHSDCVQLLLDAGADKDFLSAVRESVSGMMRADGFRLLWPCVHENIYACVWFYMHACKCIYVFMPLNMFEYACAFVYMHIL